MPLFEVPIKTAAVLNFPIRTTHKVKKIINRSHSVHKWCSNTGKNNNFISHVPPQRSSGNVKLTFEGAGGSLEIYCHLDMRIATNHITQTTHLNQPYFDHTSLHQKSQCRCALSHSMTTGVKVESKLSLSKKAATSLANKKPLTIILARDFTTALLTARQLVTLLLKS